MIPDVLTVPAILEIRRAATQKYGGDATERKADEDCIERSAGAAMQGARYLSGDDSINPLHVASLALFYFVKNHCFTDGNKRVGWMAAVSCFLTEGLDVVASDEEAVQLVCGVADDTITRDEVIEWFGQDGRLQPLPPPAQLN